MTDFLVILTINYHRVVTTEVRAMKMALAGDIALNSGAAGVAELTEDMTFLKWALR